MAQNNYISESTLLLTPTFLPATAPELLPIQSTIDSLNLSPHPEGGYFKVTDISPTNIKSPYPLENLSAESATHADAATTNILLRHMSTTIFYYLTPHQPQGSFHINRSRIIHTLHRGRGRYVLIHPDGLLESFVVGPNIEAGERLSWVVEGGVWKASYLLEDDQGSSTPPTSQGLLISETTVPGFEYSDHAFLSLEQLRNLVPEEKAAELEWLVRKSEGREEEGGSATSNTIAPRLAKCLA